jgi:uncharacterized protein (TIGR02217 family)
MRNAGGDVEVSQTSSRPPSCAKMLEASVTAPAVGLTITADFEFDVPVRFDTDHMAVTIETYQLHNWVKSEICWEFWWRGAGFERVGSRPTAAS